MLGQNQQLKGKKFPCPLCNSDLKIKLDEKHAKPYVICDPCGVQMFIRREKGIKLLERQTREPGPRSIFDPIP